MIKRVGDAKAKKAIRGIFITIRRWWYLKVLGKPQEFVTLIEFFDNFDAPWNK